LEASRVLLAVKAFERDMGAFEASEVSPAGKQGIVEEDQEQEDQEQSLSSKQVSITQL
jgi:hypothetical protein